MRVCFPISIFLLAVNLYCQLLRAQGESAPDFDLKLPELHPLVLFSLFWVCLEKHDCFTASDWFVSPVVAIFPFLKPTETPFVTLPFNAAMGLGELCSYSWNLL